MAQCRFDVIEYYSVFISYPNRIYQIFEYSKKKQKKKANNSFQIILFKFCVYWLCIITHNALVLGKK